MRTLLPLALMAVVLLAASAAAQDPTPPPGAGRCNAGFGGGGAPPGGGGPRGNGTFRSGGRGEPLPDINVTLDPPGPLTLRPGESATLSVLLRNDGSAAYALNLSAAGFRPGNATPQVSASLTPETLSVEPGATQTATLTVSVAADAPAGCAQAVPLRVTEAGTNRTAQARVVVQIPAAEPPPSPSPSPSPSPGTASAQPSVKTVPAPGMVGGLLAVAGASVLLLRRRP